MFAVPIRTCLFLSRLIKWRPIGRGLTDSWIATKWAPIRHRLNTHFQALAILRYDGRDMLTDSDACNRLSRSNLRFKLIKHAAKQLMSAEQYCSFYDDIEIEFEKESHLDGEPDGLRYFCTLDTCTVAHLILIIVICLSAASISEFSSTTLWRRLSSALTMQRLRSLTC